jgi:hypothetical protein
VPEHRIPCSSGVFCCRNISSTIDDFNLNAGLFVIEGPRSGGDGFVLGVATIGNFIEIADKFANSRIANQAKERARPFSGFGAANGRIGQLPNFRLHRLDLHTATELRIKISLTPNDCSENLKLQLGAKSIP